MNDLSQNEEKNSSNSMHIFEIYTFEPFIKLKDNSMLTMVELCHFSGILKRTGLLMFLLCGKK